MSEKSRGTFQCWENRKPSNIDITLKGRIVRRIKLFIPVFIFSLLAILLGLSLHYKGNDELPSVKIGKPMPEFSLSSLDEKSVISNLQLTGKPYLLNIWQVQCPGCRAEHHYLTELAKQGIEIVGVNLKDDTEHAIKALSELGNPYSTNLHDPDGKLSLDLGAYGTPETFVVNAEGTITYRLVGPLDEKKWKNKMAAIFFNDSVTHHK